MCHVRGKYTILKVRAAHVCIRRQTNHTTGEGSGDSTVITRALSFPSSGRATTGVLGCTRGIFVLIIGFSARLDAIVITQDAGHMKKMFMT